MTPSTTSAAPADSRHRTSAEDGAGSRPASARAGAPGSSSDADQPGAARARRARRKARKGSVGRPRLVQELVERGAPVVLVSAPAGYGKTSLVAEWQRADTRPFAWVEVEERDSAPERLLAAVVFALAEVEPVPAPLRSAAVALDGPRRTRRALAPLLERLLALVGELGRSRRATVLVLDGVERLRGEDVQRMLASLAAAVGAPGTLALISREAAPIALGRLRVEGSLQEIGAAELAMTAYEAHRLLTGAGVELGREELERLVDLTEGWPAGLYLSALSMRGRSNPAAALERVRGEEHAIRDYVAEEMLAPLPSALREFLVGASLVSTMSGPLCDEVLQRSDSASMLELAMRSALMISPCDPAGRWARCHPMLRGALLAELERTRGGELPEMHRRAAAWLADHGEVERAVDHAVAARDVAGAGELMWSAVAADSQRAGSVRLERWLARFSDEEVERAPALALARAHRQLALGRLELAERWARAAAGALQLGPDRAPASIRAALALVEATAARGGLATMGARADEAHALLDEGSQWRAGACLLRGVHRHLRGDAAAAREQLQEALRRAGGTAVQTELLALAQLALLDAEEGDWESAEERTRELRARMREHHLQELPTSALPLAVSAWVAGQRGGADEAKRDLHRAGALLEPLGDYSGWYLVQTRLLLAGTAVRLGDGTLARSMLSQASRTARSVPDCTRFRDWLDEAWGLVDELSVVALAGPRALTIAELRILRFLPTHLSFREIGDRLHVSTNTVKSQAHSIYGKLGTTSRSQAVARADELGLISAPIV